VPPPLPQENRTLAATAHALPPVGEGLGWGFRSTLHAAAAAARKKQDHLLPPCEQPTAA